MEPFGMYIFWTSLYLAVSGLVYHFLVRPLGNPAQNRFFILFALLLSCVVSAFGMWSAPAIMSTAATQALWLPEVVVHMSTGAHANLDQAGKGILETLGTKQLLFFGVLLVTGLLFLRVVGSLVYLLARIRYSKRMSMMGVTVLPVSGQISPFSFFKYVFLPIKMLEHPQLSEVIEHERAHIRKWHSIDLLLVECMTVVFWFHPAVWLFRRELKMQHEFEADLMVIDKTHDKAAYQKLLLQISMHGIHIPITTPFNYPPLKKRFMMMNKTNKGFAKKALLSMLAIIPMFTLAFFVQSCSEQHAADALQEEMEAAAAAIDYSHDVVFTVTEKQPAFPGGEQARQEFLQDELRYPYEAMMEGAQGTIYVTFVVRYDGNITDVRVLRGVTPELDEEAVRVINLMPRWEPGMQRGEPVSVRFNMPIRFRLN